MGLVTLGFGCSVADRPADGIAACCGDLCRDEASDR